MATIARAQCYLRSHPAEAFGDAVGCLAICAMVVAGFTLPGLF